MRVVFDSNILVSALALPGGGADAALTRVVEQGHELVCSTAIVDEVLGVLARKFARDAEELARVALFLAELAETAQLARRIRVLADDADNRVLECAVGGRAEAIVTGDRVMLRLGGYQGIRILSLRDYLDRA